MHLSSRSPDPSTTRRKKKMQRSMSGKGKRRQAPKRRSARLQKLEEQKNDGDNNGDVEACPVDPLQIIRNTISSTAGWKGKKNGEVQKLQGEASPSQAIHAACNISGNGSMPGQIIEWIIDTLETRDRYDLFAMPDDIQVCDYAERISRPGDFATLRQKNTDGMYQTLEQFENDVYMVFQKAMSINSQDTIPYREAMALMDQAKQVFLSLKGNRMYSESELLAWHQKQLDVGPNKRPRDQEDGNDVGGSRNIAAPMKKKVSVTGEKRQQISPRKKAGEVSAENGKAMPAPVKRARKAAATAAAEVVKPGDARVGKRRLTYNKGDALSRWRAMMTPPPLTLPAWDRHAMPLYAKPTCLVQGHTYHDSLRRFVRHAGLRACLAAEFRSLECENRARQNPSPASYWNDFATGAGMGGGGYYPPSPSSLALQTPHSGGNAIGEKAPAPECRLETDSLVTLTVHMRTPEVLERAKQVSHDTRGEASSNGARVARAGDNVTVTEAAMASPSTQTSGKGKSASAIDFGPFAPPKLAPGWLGFGQFAGSSAPPFKLKPPAKSRGKKKRE